MSSPSPIPDVPVSTDADGTDEELFERYRSTRDHEAFVQLVRRHQHTAFRYAFARCGNAELAEEAVQDVFLQIARGKLELNSVPFKIRFYGWVTSQAHTRARSERRTRLRSSNPKYKGNVQRMQESAPTELDDHQKAAVTQVLAGLNEEFRVPIVLHYMEGLTQKQIGEMVGVTQSVISRRITQGLELLKARLTQAGLTQLCVTLPILLASKELLHAPLHLQEQLASPSFLKTASHSARTTTSGVAGKTWLNVTILAAVAVMSFALWIFSQRPASQPTSAPTPPPALTNSPGSVGVPVHEVWDFSTGPVENLKVLQGSWVWEKREKIGGGMKGTSKVNTVCLLPVKRVARPLLLTMAQPYPLGPDKQVNLGAFWLKEGFTQRHQISNSTRITDPYTNLKLKMYFVDNYIITFDKSVISICEYEQNFDAESIAVCLDPAWFLSRIELHTIDPKEIPVSLQDLEGIKNSLHKNRIQEAVKVRNQP